MEILIEKVNTARDPGLQQLVETLEKKKMCEEKDTGVKTNMVRVLKLAKVLHGQKILHLRCLLGT